MMTGHNEEVIEIKELEHIEQPKVSIADFRTSLKTIAMDLVRGEYEEQQLPMYRIAEMVDLGSTKVNETYIRNCINQDKTFMATGHRIRVKKHKGQTEAGDVFHISLMPDEIVERKRQAKPMATKYKAVEVNQLIGAILAAEPDLSHLAGKEHSGAIEGARLMRQAIADAITNITSQD